LNTCTCVPVFRMGAQASSSGGSRVTTAQRPSAAASHALLCAAGFQVEYELQTGTASCLAFHGALGSSSALLAAGSADSSSGWMVHPSIDASLIGKPLIAQVVLARYPCCCWLNQLPLICKVVGVQDIGRRQTAQNRMPAHRLISVCLHTWTSSPGCLPSQQQVRFGRFSLSSVVPFIHFYSCSWALSCEAIGEAVG
jgi:hypothetical protein